MLDKPEFLAEDTDQPGFLPWEFDTGFYFSGKDLGSAISQSIAIFILIF